ncbi:MAG: SDR family oxidoreductase [Chloroflexi bacterium]|nr:MAG: SDR family oxidoreductase [Chloroflexota bacterium]
MTGDAHFFSGKRALVTGGASGIGRAVVTQLLRRGVHVTSFDVREQDDGPSPWFEPLRVDLADAAATDAACLTLDPHPVDFVCNAAGVSPLQQTTETVVAVDFLAVRRICQRLLPQMPAGGAVVNISSVAALHDLALSVEDGLLDADDHVALAHARANVPEAGLGYVVAKRAVVALTVRLAAEYASRHVRVNCTSPHFVATPMHDAIKRSDPAMYRDMPAPMGRWSSADEQADAVLFLMGPHSRYITGQNLVVDGGWQAVTATAVRTGAPPS